MKKNMIKLAAGTAAVLMMATSAQAGYTMKKKIGDVDTKLTMFGFSQLEMRGGDGSQVGTNDDISFHAQRIRLGWKYNAGKVRAKVFLDFNQDSAANSSTGVKGGKSGIGVPDTIKDAFIAYAFTKEFIPKMGVIKMPHGQGFTMPGWNLDIAERGIDKQLVLERNMGLMFSGRDIGFGDYAKVSGYEMGHERAWKGFGYDVMIANQAGRSKAVKNAQEGKGHSYAVRGMFDWTELIHVEASYAVSEKAGGTKGYNLGGGTYIPADTEDYKSYDLAFDSNIGQMGFKGEYINSENIKGTKGWDEYAYTLTAQYAINNMFEPTIKHIQAHAERNNNTSDLGNTYIGLNIFFSQFNDKFDRNSKRNRNAHKLVLNYIVASGDTQAITDGGFNGLGGYRDDAWIMQWQVKF